MYFLAGASRSGKSTLARRLALKLHKTIIQTDAFTVALRKIPQLDLPPGAKVGSSTGHITLPFWTSVINSWVNSDDVSVILEGRAISIDLAKAVIETTGLSPQRFAFLGFPGVTADQKLAEIAKYSHLPNTWLQNQPIEFQKEWLEQEIRYSHSLQEECQKAGFSFYDTANGLDDIEQHLLTLWQAEGVKINPPQYDMG